MWPTWLKQTTLLFVLMNTASVISTSIGAPVPHPVNLMSNSKVESPLPKSVLPKKYNLYLQPDISEGIFKGNVSITVHVEEPTNTVVLHAGENLNITEEDVSITYLGNEIAANPVISNITRNSTTDIMTIILRENLQKGVSYELKLLFHGYLEGTSYPNRGTYKDPNVYQPYHGFIGEKNLDTETGQMSYLATTEMSPTYARRVFPCFDEPSYKTIFEIVVGHLKNMTALSVMPLSYTKMDDADEDYVLDHFAPSPPISTSSVGVLVSDLKNSSSATVQTSEGNYTVRIFYNKQSHMHEQIENFTRLAPKVMEYLDNYFGVPYPLSEINIFFTSGFSNLNVEAFGLIVCQEYMGNIGNINFVIKQWISHLTTPQKWSYNNITNDLISFVKEDLTSKFNDGTWLLTTFDNTDYDYDTFSQHTDFNTFYSSQRGMKFLRMLNHTLTEDTIKRGLRSLVLNNKYSTYTEDMVWDELTKQALKDKTLPENASVGEIAKSWLDIYNYPVLTVKRMYEQNSAQLEQHIFFKEYPRNTTEEEEGKYWWIPITYFTPHNLDSDSLKVEMWMKNEKSAILNKLPDSNLFIIVNPTNVGFFLANYDLHNWELIAESLKASNPLIPAKTRKSVLRNALLLSQGGELNYCTAFNMTLFLTNETDYDVFNPFFDWVVDLRSHTTWTPYEQILSEYVIHMLQPTLDSLLATPYDPHVLQRSNFEFRAKDLLSQAGSNKYQNSVNYDYFNMSDNDTGANIRCPTFMRDEPEKWNNHTWEIMWIATSVSSGHSNMEKCPGFLDVIQRILDKTSDEDEIFSISTWQNSVSLLTSGPISYNLTLKYFMENFHSIRQRLYYTQDLWHPFVSNICSAIKTKDQLDKFFTFYQDNKRKFGYSQETINETLKRAVKEIKWREHNLPVIGKCFDEVVRKYLKY